MTQNISNRQMAIDLLKRLLKEVRGGRYHCRRGTVNWSKFNFTLHKYGLALSLPEEDESTIATITTVSLIFMTVIDDPEGFDLDDRTLDEFRADARLIARQLMEAKKPGLPDSVILDLAWLPSAELADTEKQLQGVSASFILEY